MNNNDDRNDQAFEQCDRTEHIWEDHTILAGEHLESLSPQEIQSLLHELQIHQIELELQNEELRQSQQALDATKARYFDLYDLAPVGYFTLDAQGLIREANLTLASMLKTVKAALVQQPITRFILPQDQDIHYIHKKILMENKTARDCELRLLRTDGTNFWAHLSASAFHETAGCRVIVSGISHCAKSKRKNANCQHL